MKIPCRTLLPTALATALWASGAGAAADAAGPRSLPLPTAGFAAAFSHPAEMSLSQSLDRALRARDSGPQRIFAPPAHSAARPRAVHMAVRLFSAPAEPPRTYTPLVLPPFPMPEAPAPITTARAEAPVPVVAPAPPPAPKPAAPEVPPVVMPVVTTVVTPVVKPAATPAPTGTALERVAASAPAILLPADSTVGLAAFRLDTELFIVLDAAIDYRRPGAEIDPAFAGLSTQRTQDATILRLPFPEPGEIRFARADRGWVVTLAAPETIAGIRPILLRNGATAQVKMPLSSPSRVVVVIDPQSGHHLLVGTQVTPGQGVLAPSQQAQYALLPTLQGVVVASLSDEIALRREGGSFTLSADSQPGGTIVSTAEPHGADLSDAAPVSQILDIPGGSTQALSRRLAEAISRAALAPPQARGAPRLQVAATMAALGMGAEAQSVIDVATADDPGLRDTPRAIGLRAVTSILAHRDDEADTLNDKRLNGTDEINLWRALRHVARDETTAADARALRDGLPVVMSYSATLRSRLLPTALETMALHGESEAAQAALRALPDRQDLDLARAMTSEALNQPDAALTLYDQVAQRPDRLPRYRALVRAAELRMKTGALDAKGAADALDRTLFGWRNAREELPLRMSIARLRRQAGQWPEAMNVLRDGRSAFPDDHGDFDQEIAATFTALLASDTTRRMTPAAFVSLYDKNLDLLQSVQLPEPATTQLIDLLLGLDLQGRAEPVLAHLLAQTQDPARRPALGARLAALRLNLDNPAGAIAALAETASADQSDPAVTAQRQLLYPRAEAARGNTDTAIAMLGQIHSAAAAEQLADLQTTRKAWPKVVAALTELEQLSIPDPANLTVQQQALVMRIAESATLASDSGTLARIGATYGAAMAKSSSAPLFRVIGSVPVRTTADLPRAYEELKLARKVRADLGPPP
jgi:hypothetical protein